MINNQRGFTLIEITMALTLFGIFIGAFYANRGANLRDSNRMREELKLQLLCEEKMNQLMLAPPPLSEGLTLMPQTENFEDPNYENYEAIIEWKHIKIPDIGTLMQAEEEEKEAGADNNANLQQKIYTQLKNNVEKLLWQVRVTVKNKETKAQYSLATWLNDENAKITLQL